jgi:hypothetical protein
MKIKEMVRPEGLELSTFWFVERQEGQSRKSISFVWRRLRIRDVALPFFNCTQSCTHSLGAFDFRKCVLVQPEMERGRSPLVSIPPFGRGFSRHRYDTRLSLSMVASDLSQSAWFNRLRCALSVLYGII